MKLVTKITLFSIVSLVGISILSCTKAKSIPTIPKIEFKSFNVYGHDSATVIIKFQDGDGNIGLTQADTSGSFSSTSPYYCNFFMKYYFKKSDGTFSAYTDPNTGDTLLNNNYRIPDLRPKGQNKVLEGEIKAKILAPYHKVGVHKVIRFDLYIYDRDLNKSNVVNTGEINLW